MSFGKVIRQARLRRGLSQKALAALVLKEDGQPITQQYLNDIEHGNRNAPSPRLIKRFAEVLDLEPEFLYYLAGEIPEEWLNMEIDKHRVVAAYRAFYRELTKPVAA